MNFLSRIVLAALLLAVLHASGALAASSLKSGDEVFSTIAASGKARVMVVFDISESDVATMTEREARQALIATTADAILSALPSNGFTLHHRYNNVTALALDIDVDAWTKLESLASVKRIDLDEGGQGAMNTAAPLAKVSNVRNRGYRGAGVKIAVIDSGVRLNHPDFAGRLSAQQCFCSSGTPGVGCCPNGTATQSGAGSAADDNGHGTNVTGIIGGNGGTAPMGGAPQVDIVSVRVLDASNSFCCASDVTAAMDWVATNHPDTDVVNMSIGTNALYSASCDASAAWSIALSQAANALNANGTVMTASAGNQGSPTSVSAPACLDKVIAAGAVWSADFGQRTVLGCTDTTTAADLPTCFSNSGARIALYAPGAFVTSTGRTAVTSSYAGTSQAAPLTASCIADLRQFLPSATPAQIRAALIASPTHVVDPKNGQSFPRLDCENALIRLDRIFAHGFE